MYVRMYVLMWWQWLFRISPSHRINSYIYKSALRYCGLTKWPRPLPYVSIEWRCASSVTNFGSTEEGFQIA